MLNSWMGVLATITWDGIMERMLSSLIMGLIVAGITLWVLKSQVRGLINRVGKAEDKLDGHDKQISKLHNQRTQCELRATHAYASRSELARIIADANASSQQLSDKLDDVHGRITKLSEGFNRFKGEMKGVPHGG